MTIWYVICDLKESSLFPKIISHDWKCQNVWKPYGLESWATDWQKGREEIMTLNILNLSCQVASLILMYSLFKIKAMRANVIKSCGSKRPIVNYNSPVPSIPTSSVSTSVISVLSSSVNYFHKSKSEIGKLTHRTYPVCWPVFLRPMSQECVLHF